MNEQSITSKFLADLALLEVSLELYNCVIVYDDPSSIETFCVFIDVPLLQPCCYFWASNRYYQGLWSEVVEVELYCDYDNPQLLRVVKVWWPPSNED